MIIGVLFAVLKEKAAQFVLGFNLLSKEEQALNLVLQFLVMFSVVVLQHFVTELLLQKWVTKQLNFLQKVSQRELLHLRTARLLTTILQKHLIWKEYLILTYMKLQRQFQCNPIITK